MPVIDHVDDCQQSINKLFTKEEVRKCLLNLNIAKSPSPKRVHPLLSELASIEDNPLCMIFNSFFEEVFEDWKLIMITALLRRKSFKLPFS